MAIKQELVDSAIERLKDARAMRVARSVAIADACRVHGWHGPLISGVEQDHWPEDIKNWLRSNARGITQAVTDANNLWRKAGRRQHTFNRILPDYRADGSRY